MVGDEKPAKATNKKVDANKNDTSKNDTAKPAKKGEDVELDLEKESKQETASSKKKPAAKTKIADEADEEREQPLSTSGKSQNNNPPQRNPKANPTSRTHSTDSLPKSVAIDTNHRPAWFMVQVPKRGIGSSTLHATLRINRTGPVPTVFSKEA